MCYELHVESVDEIQKRDYTNESLLNSSLMLCHLLQDSFQFPFPILVVLGSLKTSNSEARKIYVPAHKHKENFAIHWAVSLAHCRK